MELERMPPPPRFGLQDGLRDRSRSPEPGYGLSRPQSVDPRIHVEVAELKDKLEQTQNELRRTQAELRLNQGDYERSHVELESMQEKVRKKRTKNIRRKIYGYWIMQYKLQMQCHASIVLNNFKIGF